MAGATWCGADWCAALTNSSSIWQLVLLWTAGAIIGWMLPRPKSTQGAWVNVASAFSPTAWRRMALAWHGAIIMREIWYHFTGGPGTFRRLSRAFVGLMAGKGWHFDFPTAAVPGTVEGTPCDPRQADSKGQDVPEQSWYVTSNDLEFFKRSVGTDDNAPATDAGPWEQMMDREIAGLIKYTAWRRTLANGKTEYKSITYSPDASSEEFMDMYFDDDNRPNWDTMIIQHDVLEHGDFAQRQQVVRWIRRFPFSFISDREYVIAKRLFREGDNLYGITKSVEHPRAPRISDVVRMDVFYSMWRSRTVPCPWNSGAPACETVLIHHEQFKIPENLARFAVKHGMWGFVRKLSSETPKFVESRRKRCQPELPDPQAYGAGHKPNPTTMDGALTAGAKVPAGMRRTETSTSVLSSLTTQSSVEGGDMDMVYRSSTGGSMQRTRSGKLRGMAAFAIASGLAMLLHRSASSERLPSAGGKIRRVSSINRHMKRARTQSCFSEGGGS